ncbi:hypothetical protein RW115_12145 [Macrococcus capreoli]
MKKFEGIGELLGRNVLVDHDWFRPERNSLGHYQWFLVNSIIDNKKLVISEDVPYGSQNTRILDSIINSYEKLKENILERLVGKKEYKNAAVVYIAKVDLNYGTRITVSYLRDYQDSNITESIIAEGYALIRNDCKINIYAESVELLVNQLKAEKVFDKYFFEILNTNQFTIKRVGTSHEAGMVIISPSTRKGIMYQLTLLKKELPYGHLNIKTEQELQYWMDILEIELLD